MNYGTFHDALDRVYATFGLPLKDSRILSVWFQAVEHIPDEVMPYIQEHLCEQESLPRNMPIAMKRMWGDWKAQHPEKLIQEDCPHCQNKRAFWCWWDDPSSGRWQHFAVPCPYCQPTRPHDAQSLRELRDAGVVIMPPDYQGGPVAFDRDHGYGCLWPLNLDMSTPREKMHLGTLPDKRANERTRALTDAELDDYAQAEAF